VTELLKALNVHCQLGVFAKHRASFASG
jgi:hypothetical protein